MCFANCQITLYGIATEARTKRHFPIYVQNVAATVLLNLKSSYILKLKMPEKTKSLFLGRCPHGDLADQAELSAELAKSAQPK